MNLKKILRFIILGGLFTVPFIPFVVTGSLFFPFITGKNFLFRIIVEIIGVAWLALALRDVTYRPKKSLILWAFTAFVLIIGIADSFAPNAFKAFWSNYERMEGFVTIIHLYIYFIVAGCVLLSRKLWDRLLNVYLGTTLCIGIYGVAQLLGKYTINQGGVRVDATFGNATYLAVYMIFNIFIAGMFAARSFTDMKKKWGYAYSALALFFVFILYHTATRGAILGLIGGMGVTTLLVLIFERKNKVLRISCGVILGLGIATVLGFLAIKNTSFVRESPVLSRFASISLNDGTTKSRFMVWDMAWQGFKERPILGWGQENFSYVFNKYYNPGMYAQEQWFDRTHNVVFDWLIAGGILGLLSYLFLFGSALWSLWKSPEETFSFTEKSVMSGLFVAYFIHNFFVFDNLTSYMIFVTMLAYVHGRVAVASHKLSRVDTEVGDDDFKHIILPVCVVMLVVILYLVNFKAYAASRSLIEALRKLGTDAGQMGALAVVDFKDALKRESLGQSEIRERIIEAVSQINPSTAPINVKQDFFELGKAELAKQLEHTPDDARYQLFTGTFYSYYGLFDDALKYTLRASELSPNKQSILYQLGNLYLQKQDYTKALEVFKRAYEIEVRNEDAFMYYVIATIYSGDVQKAEETLESKYGTTLVTDDRLIRAYTDTKQWPRALALWKKRLETDPSNNQYRLQYAATFLASGDRRSAIATIREVIAKDPTFKEQGEYYIKEIEAGRNP